VKIVSLPAPLAACFLLIALPAGAGRTFDASVNPTRGFAPCDVIVKTFIEPDSQNRSVEIVVDSPGFYTSSVTDLDGERAPRTKGVQFKRLPAGFYEVTVVLFGADGERDRKTRWVEVF
jgi:hypothetical protein